MKFKSFTNKSLKDTKTRWEQDASDGLAFTPDITQLMEWVTEHKTLKDSEVAYGLFDDGASIASAICSIIVTQGKIKEKWVKFIRLSLCPSIEDGIFKNQIASVKKAVECYLTAVEGVLNLKNEHNADTIKIYGRTQEYMHFLMTVQATLANGKEGGFKATIEGRWLVLRYKTKEK